MKMHPLQIIGIILLLFGTVFIYIGQNKSAEMRNRELIKKSDKIEELSEKNMVLNQEITNLNKQITGYIAGDSYCLVTFGKFDEGTDIVNVSINNEGENPLYELSLNIIDVEKLENKDFPNIAEAIQYLKKTRITFGFKIIPPKRGEMLPLKFPFFNKTKRIFNIDVTSRGGSFW